MKKTILTLVFLFVQAIVFAQTWEQLNQKAFSLNRQKKYDEAVQIGLKALEMAKTNFGTHHIKYATSLLNLGNLHKDHNNRRYQAKADLYYKEALSFFANHPQEQNHNVEAALNMNYGMYAETMGLPNPKQYFQRAYNIYKKNMGENHGLTQNAKKKL
jgi:tetratricopeptide (TPR) repeat protein